MNEVLKPHCPNPDDLLVVGHCLTQAVSANVRLRYNYPPDSDLCIIYNVGTQFASIAPANPPQVRETRFAVKWTYSFAP
jgi:hypothetical protein